MSASGSRSRSTMAWSAWAVAVSARSPAKRPATRHTPPAGRAIRRRRPTSRWPALSRIRLRRPPSVSRIRHRRRWPRRSSHNHEPGYPKVLDKPLGGDRRQLVALLDTLAAAEAERKRKRVFDIIRCGGGSFSSSGILGGYERGLEQVKNIGSLCWERVCCPPLVARELSRLFAACSGGGGCVGRRCFGRRL